MANVRLDRRLAELESKAAAASGKTHVLYAPVGLYGAELDAWREQQIAKLPPGANVITVCFVRPGDPERDPAGQAKPHLASCTGSNIQLPHRSNERHRAGPARHDVTIGNRHHALRLGPDAGCGHVDAANERDGRSIQSMVSSPNALLAVCQSAHRARGEKPRN